MDLFQNGKPVGEVDGLRIEQTCPRNHRHNKLQLRLIMSATHKITPSNPRIASLIADVERGSLKIPVFQREYVWKDEQIMSLLDSIYQGYPVGSLLLWSTKEQLENGRGVGGFALPDTPEDYPVNYVLDGQQRLTTLYGVFNSDAKTNDRDLAQRFDVSFVLESSEFVHSSAADPGKAINLNKILDTTKLLPELQRFGPAQQKVIADLTERFKDYEFPVVTIKDRSNQEVCRVFQRINSSGTNLSTLELLAAWTWSEQFDLRIEIQALLDRLSDKGYGDLDESEVMRCLTAIVSDNINSDALVDMTPALLIDGMSKLKQAMYSAIDFLEKDIRIKNIVFVPFPIMLVPLVRFFAINLKPSATQRAALRRWFWHCAFTQRYKAGTNRLVTEDLLKMKELASGGVVFDALDATVDMSVFLKSWRINSTSAKAAICLLAQMNPRSWLTGAPVDLDDALAAYNARQFHHIYPKAYLAGQGIQFHSANVIANICMLTAADNNSINDQAPQNYFSRVPTQEQDDVFERAFIVPQDRSGGTGYADFIKNRAKALAEKAADLIKNG